MKVKKSLNVTFDETPTPYKTSPLEDDDFVKEEAIEGSGKETIVYADSDHVGYYLDRKRTSGICTFIGCCLTSWFSKKQTALAISTTKAEYVSAEKTRQQALCLKQALVDYGISCIHRWYGTFGIKNLPSRILVRCDEILARTPGHAPFETRDKSKFLYFVYTGGNGIDVVVLKESIRAISERFSNTTYSFLLGKRVAYSVVANYVRNTYGKYGLVRSMFSSSFGLCSFQFSSNNGLDAMLMKMGFKPTKQQVFQPVSKMPTANTSENKKKNVEPTKEVRKSNSFDVLTLVEKGVKLEKVNDDHDDEVSLTDNEMASFLSKKDGYGTQSLLGLYDDDYEYDLYDDDMYERHKIPEKLQAFCDNLDIKVRGRKKK
uniref:Retrovirus-related Pol polyprotein from transposon TNT 1-94 n=1 Tax=Tanacetum cinerariifolium TaxID=118510 RepID=A0A6L2MXF8_TANCI|nr:retrovirus-related Pol polyprotein from transposon TNT 1-94 [Tanacetum cinerariifolium]